MIILNTKEIEFIPSSEQEKERPLTFYITLPKMETSLKIQQIFLDSVEDEAVKKSGKENKEIKNLKIDQVKLVKTVLLDCVVGWKNVFYLDEKGAEQELEFSKDNFMFLNNLEILLELFNKINELSNVNEQDKKKLKKP